MTGSMTAHECAFSGPEKVADSELVRAAQLGDRRAFAELVERHQAMALAVAFSASGELASTEDLAQEALITAWTRLAELSDPDKFRPWLAAIVRNSARYWLRHRRRHAPVATASLDEMARLAAVEPSPLERAQLAQDLERTRRALAALPRHYREPLLLYYALGESYAEVASTLELSEATVRQRLCRARKRLNDEVEGIAPAAMGLVKATGMVAVVMTAIRSRAAWAHAPRTPAAWSSPKMFLGLGALGGSALFACVAALAMLLGGQSHSISEAQAGDRDERASVEPSQASILEAPADSMAVSSASEPLAEPSMRAFVHMGSGKVGDRDASRSSGSKHQPRTERSQQVRRQDGSVAPGRAAQGSIRKHGPAVLLPEKKPLLRPSLDALDARRAMWGD